MKKHFLLLMLMALLPLAGWADDFENVTVQVGKFTYGGNALPAIQVLNGGFELQANTHYTNDGKVYSDDKFSTEVDFSDMVYGTTYYVKILGVEKTVYEGMKKAGAIEVKKAPLTLQVNGGADLTKQYRAADPDATKLEYTLADGSTPKNGDQLEDVIKGELTYAYTGQPNASVKDDIALTFSGLTADNYEISYEALNIDIKAKTFDKSMIKAVQGNLVYNGLDQTPTYTLKDGDYTMQVDVDYTVTTKVNETKADVHDVASYTVTIAGTENYTGQTTVDAAEKDLTFEVTKATLSVGAMSISKTYKGSAYSDSDLTDDYDVVFYGLLGDDVDNTSSDLSGYVKPTFAVEENAKDVKDGGYKITLTGGSSKNYNFLLQNTGVLAGKLTVTPFELTVTADNKTMGVGAALPAFTCSYSGFATGETVVDAIETAPTMTTTATSASAAGDYPITISGGAAKSNYTIKTYKNGKLTIGKVGITLTILPASKVYGDADPDWLGAEGTPKLNVHYVVNGLLDGDELQNVHITRATGDNFGKYVMTATWDAPDASKYTGVKDAPAQFSITARPLTVKVLPQTLENNAEATALVTSEETVEVSGLVNGAKVEDVVTLAFNTSVIGTQNVDYANGIKASLKSGVKNYSFDDVTGRLVFGTGSSELTISDADNAIFETIKLYNGQTKNVTITLNRNQTIGGEARTWDAEQWNTIVLPFEVTPKQVSEAFGYAIVNVINASKSTGKKIVFELNMNEKIPANTPFAVKNYAAVEKGTKVTFKNVTIAAPENEEAVYTDAGEGKKFYGAYTTKTLTNANSDCYFLINDGWANITKDGSKWDVLPFNAYVQAASAGVRGIEVSFEELDGSTTAIRSIDADDEIDGNVSSTIEGWYNLNGVKIDAPVQKGIYIHNGKTIMIK